MTYSIDSSYLDFYRCAIDDRYASGFLKDRCIATAFAAGTSVMSSFRTIGRIAQLVVEVAKIAFYAVASLFTWGGENFERLKAHCKIVLIDVALLVLHPIQMATHSVAIAAAIISPKAAYRMMSMATTPVEWITSREQEIWHQYTCPTLYDNLTRKNESKVCSIIDAIGMPWAIQNAAKQIFTEFPTFFHSGLLLPFSLMGRFHLFEANPDSLTTDQQHMTPILLLHGNRSNQVFWAGVLHSMKTAGNKRPVFTMKLPPNCRDLSIILDKIDQIKDLYQTSSSSFEVDLIGHSMGSNLIQGLTQIQNKDFKIRKAITIGTPFYFDPKAECGDLLEIIGERDYLIRAKSRFGKSVEIDATHTELIYHPQTLSEINQFL